MINAFTSSMSVAMLASIPNFWRASTTRDLSAVVREIGRSMVVGMAST